MPSMGRYMLHLILWVAVMFAPLQVQARGNADVITDGLFAVGRVLLDEGQQRFEERQPPAEGDQRTWGDRGMEIVESVMGGEGGFAQAIKDAVDVVLNEYRGQFKEEGRAYARELGDIISDRVTSNPEISSTLSSVRVLCWGVIVYLTLVTIYLVFTVHRLRRANKRLMDLVEDQIRKLTP